MGARLGINIDHVATLRQQRGEEYPGLVRAARCALNAGADQITIHLREDRRHIQDPDVPAIKLVTKEFGRPLNLEMGHSNDILEVALATAPDWVCLVPEKRQELTTEGGLNLLDSEIFKSIELTCDSIRAHLKQTKISLFLESNTEILQQAAQLKVDAVEIHTGEYARSVLNGEGVSHHLTKFELAKKFLLEHNIAVHAGHGLTLESLRPLAKQAIFEEYNIGHWAIAEALFGGLEKVVGQLKDVCNESC